MDIADQNFVVSRLCGYLQGLAAVDGKHGDSIASAHIVSLEHDDLRVGLHKFYADLAESDTDGSMGSYEFDEPAEISDHDLRSEVRSMLLLRPLGSTSPAKAPADTLDAISWDIADLIRIARNNERGPTHRFGVHWRTSNNDVYFGKIFLISLARDFLMIKLLSKR